MGPYYSTILAQLVGYMKFFQGRLNPHLIGDQADMNPIFALLKVTFNLLFHFESKIAKSLNHYLIISNHKMHRIPLPIY